MNDSQGRVIPSRPIPRRPSVQPGQSPSLPKRSFLLSESLQPSSAPFSPESEQSPILATSSPTQSEDANHPPIQSPMPAEPDSTQSEDGNDPAISSLVLATTSSDNVDARSAVSEMATVKRVALAPNASIDGKSKPSPYPAIIRRSPAGLKISAEKRSRTRSTPYPAMISSKRERKWGLLDWVTSFAFLK